MPELQKNGETNANFRFPPPIPSDAPKKLPEPELPKMTDEENDLETALAMNNPFYTAETASETPTMPAPDDEGIISSAPSAGQAEAPMKRKAA